MRLNGFWIIGGGAYAYLSEEGGGCEPVAYIHHRVQNVGRRGKDRIRAVLGGQKVYDPREIDRFAARVQGREPAEGVLVFYVMDSGERRPHENAGGAAGEGVWRPGKVYRDRASGLNEKRKGLARLLDDAEEGRFGRVAVTAKDRLSRFGASYLQRHLDFPGVEPVVLDGEREKGVTDELMDDFMALPASFSGRFNKLRSVEHRRLPLDRARKRIGGARARRPVKSPTVSPDCETIVCTAIRRADPSTRRKPKPRSGYIRAIAANAGTV